MDAGSGSLVRLFLCGDVMLGRGVDQLLPRPGDPALRETYAADARVYVELAEAANGPIPRPVGYAWPWGDALAELDEAAPDARVVNLETSITRSAAFAPGKSVHYRMSPGNVPALAAAHPDVCVLANNHLIDFGRRGLDETLDALAGAGLRAAGAGRDAGEAWRPAIVPVPRHGGGGGGGRVLVFSFGMPSSGIPEEWAATGDRSGVAFLPEASEAAAAEVTARVSRAKRPGDVAVASVHWGSNWGYDVPPDQVRFAHALIDGGVDVVHGHSSHHPRPLELYRGRLILYGCGDLIDDYEGIGGCEEYRDELRLLYFATVAPGSGGGRLAADGGVPVRMVPMRARRARLVRASREDTAWLRSVLDGVSRGFGVRVDAAGDGTLTLRSATGSG